jgi:hypothetical protein
VVPNLATGESTRGVALLATPDSHVGLDLPFPVEEEVIVDTTYATRQLFEGLARRPRYRVVVLDADGARLYVGEGAGLVEVEGHGFPVRVIRPVEQDTPHADLPRHETVRDEDRRIVERAVAAALTAVHGEDPRPLVVVGERRRVADLQPVLELGDDLAGVVHGDHGRDRPDQLAALALPVVDHWLGARRERACERLRDAVGRGRAVTTVPEVVAAATEGRGRELIVEEGFTMPRTWADGLVADDDATPQLETEDMVDDVIEQVLLSGGEVTFVDRDALDECGQIGLLLRW